MTNTAPYSLLRGRWTVSLRVERQEAKTMPRREGAPLGLWEAKGARDAAALHRRCAPGRVFTDPFLRGRGAQVWTQVTHAPSTRWTPPPQCPRLKIRSANGHCPTQKKGFSRLCFSEDS